MQYNSSASFLTQNNVVFGTRAYLAHSIATDNLNTALDMLSKGPYVYSPVAWRVLHRWLNEFNIDQ
jgi:hypothetical protein